jgi:hypothetical protein
MENEKVKRVQELRRSNAATAIPSKKKYKRKTKNKKEKILQYYSDLVSPFFK